MKELRNYEKIEPERLRINHNLGYPLLLLVAGSISVAGVFNYIVTTMSLHAGKTSGQIEESFNQEYKKDRLCAILFDNPASKLGRNLAYKGEK